MLSPWQKNLSSAQAPPALVCGDAAWFRRKGRKLGSIWTMRSNWFSHQQGTEKDQKMTHTLISKCWYYGTKAETKNGKIAKADFCLTIWLPLATPKQLWPWQPLYRTTAGPYVQLEQGCWLHLPCSNFTSWLFVLLKKWQTHKKIICASWSCVWWKYGLCK